MDYHNDYTTPVILNAWALPSFVRHQVIFQALDALPPDYALTLVNDHDPKPLFYQLDAEQPNVFSRQAIKAHREDLFAVIITRQSKRCDSTQRA